MISALLAQIQIAPGGTGGTSTFSGLTDLSVSGIISALITLALIVAAVIFFFMLVLGGIKWITAGGDKAQTEAARGQLTSALIGLVIVFSAWAILTLIGNFFGLGNVFEDGFALPSATGGAPQGGGAGTN